MQSDLEPRHIRLNHNAAATSIVARESIAVCELTRDG